MNHKESIGIIGSGIAGLSCCYFLGKEFDLTLIDQNNYLGGHTNTVTIKEAGKSIPIDTGFMVFNDYTYPNLLELFSRLNVKSYETSMSFGVQNLLSGHEMSFSSLNTIFAQRQNLLNPKFVFMIKDILRFFKDSQSVLASKDCANLTLHDFIISRKYGKELAEWFLLPMIAAIWSSPTSNMKDYPVLSLFQFMSNHGLLGVGTQFQWRTVQGGSQNYKKTLLEESKPEIWLNSKIRSVSRFKDKFNVTNQNGEKRSFDKVIIATHADQARLMLEHPTAHQKELLSPFKYNINTAVLHSDDSVMPSSRRAWASWNYRIEQKENRALGSTHYWMNNLQSLDTTKNYFVSIDYSPKLLNPNKIHWQSTYEHPRYSLETLKTQPNLSKLNENGSLFFCGSYFGNGFHEDALNAGIEVSKNILQKKDIWK